MKKCYSIVETRYVMEDPMDIVEFDYGKLAAMVGYDDTLLITESKEEAMDAFEKMESSYTYEGHTLYITEIDLMEQEQDDDGSWKDAKRICTAEAYDDDLREAKEAAEALTVDGDMYINALDLLKAFVDRFGNDDRGCYDDNRNWFSAKTVTEFIKEFAEETH